MSSWWSLRRLSLIFWERILCGILIRFVFIFNHFYFILLIFYDYYFPFSFLFILPLPQVKVHPKIYDNFAKLINRKEPSDDVFDRLNSVNLNAHLKKFMDGLSAKVFRTFNASYTLEKELEKVEIPEDATVEEKVFG